MEAAFRKHKDLAFYLQQLTFATGLEKEAKEWGKKGRRMKVENLGQILEEFEKVMLPFFKRGYRGREWYWWNQVKSMWYKSAVRVEGTENKVVWVSPGEKERLMGKALLPTNAEELT